MVGGQRARGIADSRAGMADGGQGTWDCITKSLFSKMERDFLDLPEDPCWNSPQARGFPRQASWPWENRVDYLGEGGEWA